jgi:ribose-phosphate pyrophosphokinase
MESKEDNNNILIYCESNAALAKSLVSLPDAQFIKIGNISWKTFEDGFPNIMITDVKSIRSKHCIFLLDFLNLEKIFEQLSVIYALPRYYTRSLTLVLSYFPTGTMERIDEEGQIATAMTLARLFSCIPLSTFGPARIIIYDIHALQERFYFGDNVIPILSSAIPIFVEKLQKNHGNESIAIVFPDEGAWKRFHNQFIGYKLIICTKVRDGDKRIVTVGEGQEYCKDSHVFIVDDLVKTGGTLLECKKALRNFGAKFVSAFVTHAVFPKSSWKRFTSEPEDTRFKHFYTTNSCPTTIKDIHNLPPFEVLDLAPSLLSLVATHRHL